MDNNQTLKDIYKDFFGGSLSDFSTNSDSDFKVDEEIVENDEINYIDKIDELFISDESKILLKKIISYMEKYDKKEETNYISFNISLETDDNNLNKEISDILNYYAKKYNYVDGNSITNVTLYKLEKPDALTEFYNKNSLINITDLDALEMNDVNFKKKFFYILKESIGLKKITIVTGKKEILKSFLQNDDRLSDSFCFNLFGSIPTNNDVYNDILDKIDNMNFDKEFNIKLLDYITNTYSKSNLDYSSYVNDLYKYISFNKDLPKVEEVKSVDEVFKDLNELVGLEKVKKTLYDLVDLITLKNKTHDDLKINNVNLHMVFLGNPGTGKTTVARMISEILYDLKYIKQNKLIEVSSKDLVAEYVGQTAVKTMNVVEKALGGILFVDEAYALADKNGENTYNGEAIATLIKAMEDYRDNLVVIFAGYTKEMQDFLDSNSGIVSRIGYTLEFDDYTNQELIDIFKGMVTKAGFILEDGALDEVNKLIDEHRIDKNFGNARFIRNVYEKSIINHASNTKNNKSKKILKTITKKDIKY